MDSKTLKELENQYLKYKYAYYIGKPLVSDPVFDTLEQLLKDNGSNVIKQVGTKSNDYTFNHPTQMLSLNKIQMEESDNKYNEFQTWYNNRIKKLGIQKSELMVSPKFDGSAINIIYKSDTNNKLVLTNILTRHDESHGKDITEKLKSLVPSNIPNIGVEKNSTLEIRCEVVINKDIFEEKYSNEYENPRNFVSGILHTDENIDVCKDLYIQPVHYILNGKHLPPSWFKNLNFNNEGCINDIYKKFYLEEYHTIISEFEELREINPFQLDGVVISFQVEYRFILGENDHDPLWAVAIKFIPEEAVTVIKDIEWNTGKTGELTPVVIIEPVRLAGTTVKRTSGYNAGYIIENRLGPGAIVSMVKSGDIIPMIKEVKSISPETFDIPGKCPSCKSKLTLDGIHLLCTNEACGGKIAKRLLSSFRKLKLKGIGPATLQLFSNDFIHLADLIYWIRKNGNNKNEIEKYGFKHGSRSHEIFMNVFNGIESVTYDQVILMLGLDNIGKSLAKEISNYHNGVEYSFKGHDKALVEMLNSQDIRNYILEQISYLNASGITVVCPGDKNKPIKNNTKNMEEIIYVCMTGSPKPNWSTKENFIEQFDNVVECSITDKKINYLITDSMDSITSKMKKAEEKGIPIMTYEEFYESN
jgi:DNA ligase (NAD+)